MVELHNILSKRLRFFSNLCVIVRRPGLYQLLALPPWQNDEFTLSIAVTYEKIGWSKLRLRRELSILPISTDRPVTQI
jgi:hypothetical protein